MHQGLERAADRFGDRPALLAANGCWSWRDLDGMSNAFARHLAARGVSAGQRVAVMTANRPEFDVVPRLPSGKVLRRTLRDACTPSVAAPTDRG